MSGDIIRAGAVHADVIAALHEACFPDQYEGWDSNSVAEILAMPGAFGLVGCVDEEPVGFVLARIAADEAEIISIAVLSQWRRNGMASRLFGQAVERVGEAGGVRLFLEVAADNTEAEAFYRRHGFIDGGRRKDYYRRPDGRVDALILRLDL